MMPARRDTGRADTLHYRTAKRKRKSSPPWGKILGGKPIERNVWNFEEKIDLDEELVRSEQFSKMLKLKWYYKIVGGDNPPKPVGVVPAATDWIPWYELALAIASEFDDSLKIIDAPPHGKTTRRWRGGLEGLTLLHSVDALREAYPNRSLAFRLQRLRIALPKTYGKMPLKTLGVKYQEAKRYKNAMKRTAKTPPTS
jgi:hypothetical protein